MRVLIACESSGVVREAFRRLGHDAWSCDLLPPDDGSHFHFQCDFREIINNDFDFVGYHPDCRVMANSGVRWLDTIPGRRRELLQAAALFQTCLDDPRPGYVENSIMHCHAKALISRQQDQTIQPWHFGEPFFKATCLWLRGGIQPLKETNRLTPPKKGTPEHKDWSAIHMASPGPDRWKFRSRTFLGIGEAIAAQYGHHEPQN